MAVNKSTRCRTRFMFWLLLFLIAGARPVLAQKYFFEYYGFKKGLNVEKVYAIQQDSKGFLWLATPVGVSRFDGKSFVNYTADDGLDEFGVKCITEDPDGNIWFGHLNGGGISRYSGKGFEEVTFDSIEFNGDVTSIKFVNDTSLWITTEYDGAFQGNFPLTSIKDVKVRQYKGNDISDQVIGSAILNTGEIICITPDVGMKKFNSSEEKFENYRLPHLPADVTITCLLDDSGNNIWFGTYHSGLYRYDLSESEMEFIDLVKAGMSSNWVTCILEDSKGRIWVGTWGGGIALFEEGGIRIFNRSNGLEGTGIYNLSEDSEGNILISDETKGMIIFKGDGFISLGDEVLPEQVVTAVYQDRDGYSWFGTYSGITRYALWSGMKPDLYTQDNSSIPKDIGFFREDLNGNLWIGSSSIGGGLIKYNYETRGFSMPEINKLILNRQVKALDIDRDNNIWIGTLDGFIAVKSDGATIVNFDISDSITVKEPTALHCDRDGFVWIGISNPGGSGLIKFDPVSSSFIAIDSLVNIIPRSILLARNGTLVIGTDNGLLLFRDNRIDKLFRKRDGLLSDNINLLIEADDGSIFIGSNAGLNRFFPESGRIISYTGSNGFTGLATSPGAAFKTPGGEILLGTANGAIIVNPGRLPASGPQPLPTIGSIRINDHSYVMNPGMKLKYKENRIIFNYFSVSVTNPGNVRYQVKLDGLDREWQMISDTVTKYSALPSGRYTFMVKATNSYGEWSEKPAEFQFVIKPPYYFSPWFIISMLALLITSIVIYIKIRERNLVLENRHLETKVAERTAEVVQKSQIIEEKNRDITASIRYAERIQRAMLPKVDDFEETFVLFMPKDIVSGDFYWMYDEDEKWLLAVVDCTGHGVPGAFMSIIGHNSLNKVVREYGIVKPSEILRHLDTEVISSIIQSQEKGINDGMDLAIIAFDKRNFTLEFAGAYNPLYHVRNGEVKVYKGDRFPIGMTTVQQKKNFTNVIIELKPGDMLYMCTDGYADQFGSPDVKKFKTVNIKKLLAEISYLPVQEQRNRLEKEILDWKGDLAQVDDILFVGTRIKG